MMLSPGVFNQNKQKTASLRGGPSHHPVSPLVGVIFACVILGFIWAWILSSPAAVMAAGKPAAVDSRKVLSPVFTPEVIYWGDRIVAWAENTGLDPNLVATVMQIESCGDPLALSRAGALGLFQVMPYHFIEGEDPYDPETNARRGLGYLQKSMHMAIGNVHLALAGYNGGIGIIGYPESEWREQTARYAAWGKGIYSDAVSGVEQSGWVWDWFQTSGASLCAQAHARLGLIP